MARVMTTQQLPTANTVAATSKNASAGIRNAGTAPPMLVISVSKRPKPRLASLSMKPKPTTMASVVMPLAPLKKCSKNFPTVMIFWGTYSRNWAIMAMIMPWTRSLP